MPLKSTCPRSLLVSHRPLFHVPLGQGGLLGRAVPSGPRAARCPLGTAVPRGQLVAIVPQRRGFALVSSDKKKQQQKKQPNHPTEIRLLPTIPGEMTKETRFFFKNEFSAKAMLDLVLSPNGKGQDTEEDRKEYERERRKFLRKRGRQLRELEMRKRVLEESCADAIRNLPGELYAEAVSSDNCAPDETRKVGNKVYGRGLERGGSWSV